jgi:hypothetical protein
MSYLVHFYRSVLGVPFALPRGRIEIRSARDEARAVAAAKRKFARRLGVPDWSLRADRFDVVCSDQAVPT